MLAELLAVFHAASHLQGDRAAHRNFHPAVRCNMCRYQNLAVVLGHSSGKKLQRQSFQGFFIPSGKKKIGLVGILAPFQRGITNVLQGSRTCHPAVCGLRLQIGGICIRNFNVPAAILFSSPMNHITLQGNGKCSDARDQGRRQGHADHRYKRPRAALF